MNKLALIAFMLLICVSGHGQQNSSYHLPIVDVEASLGSYRTVPVSEIVSAVEYIPLETGREFLVGRIEHVIVSRDRIFVAGQTYCYAFTRDGKFISDMGRLGRGPGEWTSVISEISVDKERRILYIDVGYEILAYTWDGKFLREIEIPGFGSGDFATRASKITFLRNNVFLGWMSSVLRKEPPFRVVFDDRGTTIKTVDNRMGRVSKSIVWKNDRAMHPSIVSGQAYFKDILNDTIYRLDSRYNPVPAFVFNLGRFSPLRSEAASSPEIRFTQRPYMEIPPLLSPYKSLPERIFLTSDIIFFPLTFHNLKRSGVKVPQGNRRTTLIGGTPMVRELHKREIDDTDTILGLYRADTGKTELLDRDPVTHQMGLINDLDGGLPFWPKYYNETENEFADIREAYEMKELLTEEYFAARTAKDPAAHDRLRALLKNLNEYDNPVIVIAKLKK